MPRKKAKRTSNTTTKKPQAKAAKKSASAGKRGAQPAKAKITKKKRNAIQKLVDWLKAFIGLKEAKTQKAKKKKRKTSGFAETKEYPTRKHPAKYKRKRSGDDVEYITFTHSDKVEINGKIEDTIPLTSNINPDERGKKKSYAYPRVYKGKRSALGSETDKYDLTKQDSEIVDNLFDTLPKVEVRYTSNSKKKSQNKKSRK